MNLPSTPRQEILQIIRAGGNISMNDIFDRSVLATDKKQVSNALYNLKWAGQIVRNEDGLYYAVETEEEPQTQGGAGELDRNWDHFTAPPAAAGPANEEPVSTDCETAPAREERLSEKAADHRPPDIPIPASMPDSLVAALESAAEATQAALDEYLYAIADPCMLSPLKHARDQAAAALNTYQAMQAHHESRIDCEYALILKKGHDANLAAFVRGDADHEADN